MVSFRFDFIPSLKISEITVGAELYAERVLGENQNVPDGVRMLYARCNVVEDTLFYQFWEQQAAFAVALCGDYLDDRTNLQNAYRGSTLQETSVE